MSSLRRIPHLNIGDVKEYLVNSKDKNFDGESLRAYKQLRAYQLFDERHVHAIEANLWVEGSHFYFVCTRCFASQDTSKSPYKCVLCVDRRVGRCYGARCCRVSGLGEVCSHVAAVLFALEDSSSHGMHLLSGPSVTNITCKWNKPCSQKVNPLPLFRLDTKKASSGGRKRKA